MYNDETLEHFKTLIENKISELTKKSYDLHVDEDGDEVDQAQSALIMSMAYEQRDRSNGKIEQLKDALNKITDKTYGACEECDHDISVKRLEACLDARYCIGCAEILEKNQRAYR